MLRITLSFARKTGGKERQCLQQHYRSLNRGLPLSAGSTGCIKLLCMSNVSSLCPLLEKFPKMWVESCCQSLEYSFKVIAEYSSHCCACNRSPQMLWANSCANTRFLNKAQRSCREIEPSTFVVSRGVFQIRRSNRNMAKPHAGTIGPLIGHQRRNACLAYHSTLAVMKYSYHLV